MTQQFLTVWLAGVMMGAGASLLLSRCAVPSSSASSKTVASASSTARTMTAAESAASLFDPRILGEPPLQRTEPGGSFRMHPASSPFEPRLLPEGEASPVPEPSAGKHVGGTGAKSLAQSPPQQANFRAELEAIAPGFPEVALEELEALRSLMEADTPLGLTGELPVPHSEIAPTSGLKPPQPSKTIQETESQPDPEPEPLSPADALTEESAP